MGMADISYTVGLVNQYLSLVYLEKNLFENSQKTKVRLNSDNQSLNITESKTELNNPQLDKVTNYRATYLGFNLDRVMDFYKKLNILTRTMIILIDITNEPHNIKMQNHGTMEMGFLFNAIITKEGVCQHVVVNNGTLH